MSEGNDIIHKIRLWAHSQIVQFALERNQKASTYSWKLAQYQYTVNKNKKKNKQNQYWQDFFN